MPKPQAADAEIARALERAAPRLSAWLAQARIERGVREQLAGVYAPLAAELARRIRAHAQTRAHAAPALLGIAGAQGSGKSTLSALLALLLEAGFELRVAVLSLDDFYATRSTREQLARDVHPLLRTRGVPGTHEVALAAHTIDAVLHARSGHAVPCPRFDKARDDRAPESQWSSLYGPFDAVLFEGWCVGATPEADAALIAPINALEREHDADASFRRYVNAQLGGAYRALFDRLDAQIFLAVPDLQSALAWRREQERKLAEDATGPTPGLMDDAQLARFAQHFERIARHMLDTAPARADVVLRLGADHLCQRVTWK
jgi:D-glycerate 3-kinase